MTFSYYLLLTIVTSGVVVTVPFPLVPLPLRVDVASGTDVISGVAIGITIT